MSGKTVFISYRRSALGKSFARSIKLALTPKGYDVFLDVDDIDAGRWAETLRREVPEREHFLLLLVEGVFERCADPKDWVRKEIEMAWETGRNIVPVLPEDADLVQLKSSCPPELLFIFDQQIHTLRNTGFDADIEALLTRFISPHKAPASPTVVYPLIAPTRLPHCADKLFGREDELAALDAAWADPGINVMTLVAWGGVGKTSLVAEWMARQAAAGWSGMERVFDWSFYSQGTRDEGAASADRFVRDALIFFGDPAMADSNEGGSAKGARLAALVAERRTLLVLDGLEPLQHSPGPVAGFLKDLAGGNPQAAGRGGRCTVSAQPACGACRGWRDWPRGPGANSMFQAACWPAHGSELRMATKPEPGMTWTRPGTSRSEAR